MGPIRGGRRDATDFRRKVRPTSAQRSAAINDDPTPVMLLPLKWEHPSRRAPGEQTYIGPSVMAGERRSFGLLPAPPQAIGERRYIGPSLTQEQIREAQMRNKRFRR